jgi:hypothetical protein
VVASALRIVATGTTDKYRKDVELVRLGNGRWGCRVSCISTICELYHTTKHSVSIAQGHRGRVSAREDLPHEVGGRFPDEASPRESRCVHVCRLAAIAAVFSLSCDAILDLGVAANSGKGQVTLLRQLWDLFRPGDVVPADSLMCNWRNLFEFQEREIHLFTRPGSN